MKKKTMQTIFVLLFIAGVIAGYLLPGDLKALANKSMSKQAMANVFDVPKKLGQLDMENEYFKYTVLASVETGSIELLRIDDKIPMHKHPKENHFVYIFKGRAKGTIGSTTAEVSPGQLVAIPAGIPHSFERVGDAPVEVILFSSPPFIPADIVWMDKR